MSGRNTLELLNGILTGITTISQLTEGYQYEDFLRDEPTYAKVTASVRSIDEMAHQIPTIIRVKYALLPWKELSALEEAVAHADAASPGPGSSGRSARKHSHASGRWWKT